jgi:hypothetical protein
MKAGAAVIKYVPYALALLAAALEARRERDLAGVARLVPVLRLSQAFVLMGFLIAKWWEHHLVFLLFPLFFALRVAFLEPVRARLAAVLVLGSTLWIAVVGHPLLWEHLADAKWETLRTGLAEGKRLAVLALGVAIELLVWRLRRLPPEPRASTEMATPAAT